MKNLSSDAALFPVTERPVFHSKLIHRCFQSLNVPDRLTLLYLLFTSVLVIVCRERVPRWSMALLIHAGLALMIVALASLRQSRVKWIQFLSHFYPLLLPGFFFEEIGWLVHSIFPQWFDRYLIAADFALFGAHPTVWAEQFHSYWLSEFLQLSYTLYLPLIPAFGVWLWSRGERQRMTRFVTALCATYYLNYLIFLCFPIEGPHHTLAHLQQVELTGGPFTDFINLIEKHGRVHGGAFPSNHVAGSMVVLFAAFGTSRRLGWMLLPLILSICAATIYGRYHYAVDVFAGTLMAALGCWLAGRGLPASEK